MNLFQNYLDFEPISSFKETLLLEKNPKHAEELFFSHKLTFGTAGLRGLMQPGVSGINGYTIAKAAKALGLYLKKNSPNKPLTCCISYDNRHHSMQFAEISARILAALGISVKLARHLRPTPWLSFAIKKLSCDAGIMITASHNPKNYNGFKAYLHDGGQVVSPHDQEIMKLMDEVHDFSLASPSSPLIELIDESIDRHYIQMLKHKFKDHKPNDLAIVYSPLCGTGATLVPLALNELGFHNLFLVKEEMQIDPDFAGITSPNPESEKACQRACDLLLQANADIALITDPDADRLGLIINHHGKAIKPNGNQIAVLILDFLIQTFKDIKDGVVVSSFVTTKALETMCKQNGLIHKEVLTGFKYIGQIIEELEKTHSADRFLLGAEESYGYLVGTHAKDKDAIISSVVLAKASALAKLEHMTLYDKLLKIYEKYGLFAETTFTIDYPTGTTSEQIKKKLEPFIENPPTELFGEKILIFKNFQKQQLIDLQTHQTSSIQLPKTDALGFYSKHHWLMLRPSGTEPKLKIYAGSYSNDNKNIELAKESLELKLEVMLKEFCTKHLG
jgi:phosphomannomutase